MARSLLPNPTNDLISDSGAVLWSIVKGEQLEYPLEIAFIDNAAAGFIYEAVVIEANNTVNQEEYPVQIQPNGVGVALNIRVPTFIGEWHENKPCAEGEVITYEGVGYVLTSDYSGNISPVDNSIFQPHLKNTIYIQFPSTLGTGYNIQPTAASNVYGFFELRVTEPSGVFPRTWKPVRGLVELLFSPSDLV